MTTARVTMLNAVTERDWQGFVVSYAALKGWQHFHDLDSRRNNAGFPDLVLVRDGRVVFVELKKEDGRVTTAQQRWLDELGKVAASSGGAVETYCWRPSDEDQVRKVLA